MAQRTTKRPSTSSAGLFSSVQVPRVNRSLLVRDRTHKTTFDAGSIVPIWCDEVLPGDSVRLRLNGLIRLATPLKPVMDNMYVDFHCFFVPCDQVWENWKHFMGERKNVNDTTDYLVPQHTVAPSANFENSLYAYIGIPGRNNSTNELVFNELPLRGYVHIWDNWYRDQDIQDPIGINKGDSETSGVFQVLKRNKRADYFTRLRPWPQKGDPVDIPLGTTAPVISDGSSPNWLTVSGAQDRGNTQLLGVANTTGTGLSTSSVPSQNTTEIVRFGSNTGLQADLSGATAATINQLRMSFQIQRLLERDARSGTRYPEVLMAHFGVMDPMYLILQRPQYLGGGTVPIFVNPIAQTTPETGEGENKSTPQGNLAAVGTGQANGIGFTSSFTQHGYVYVLMSARADQTYQHGLHRMWKRRTKYDFYWPALAMLGEQPVYRQEIYADGSSKDTEVMGYQERWSEYRYGFNRISGKFLTKTPTGSLDPWHLAQSYSNHPTLSPDFIQENPPMQRIKAVTDEPDFIADFYFSERWARPMPIRSIPGMIDHL